MRLQAVKLLSSATLTNGNLQYTLYVYYLQVSEGICIILLAFYLCFDVISLSSLVYKMRVSEQTTLDMTDSLYKVKEYRSHLLNVANGTSHDRLTCCLTS